MKELFTAALTTALTVGTASLTFAAANPFTDVPADHWAYDAVTQLAQDGVIEGYGDATFKGSQKITRYEMAQMIAKAMAKNNVSAADKALIDKLTAEFSDELNNLGVRVANLERNADNVKWNGEMRYTYTSQRIDGQKRANKDELLLRLEPSAEVNQNWKVKAVLIPIRIWPKMPVMPRIRRTAKSNSCRSMRRARTRISARVSVNSMMSRNTTRP